MGAGFAKALARDQHKGSLNINFQWVHNSSAWLSEDIMPHNQSVGQTDQPRGDTCLWKLALRAVHPQLCVGISRRGVAFGDSWISPTDFLAAWGPYLNALSLLDGQPLSNTGTFAANAQVHTTCSIPIVYSP